MQAEQQWYEAADHPEEIEYVLALHTSRWQAAWDGLSATFSPWLRTVVVCNRGRDCCNDNMAAAAAACSGNLLVTTMDDLFAPAGWDTALREAVADLEREAVVHCLTPNSRQDIYIPQILTRRRLERYGYLGYPAYESMCLDLEFTEVAQRDGVVVEATHIVFDHHHPSRGYPGDEIHALETRPEACEAGDALYFARRAAGYPPN